MTTVRELVDIATTELDHASRNASMGNADAGQIAATWPAFMVTGQRFVQEAIAYTSGSQGTSAIRALCALLPAPPVNGASRTIDRHMGRATTCIAAAADLLNGARDTRSVSSGARTSTAVEGVRLLAAAAQITIQTTVHDLDHVHIVESAAAVLVQCQGVLGLTSESPRMSPLEEVATARSTLRPADALYGLDTALQQWIPLAARSGSPPAPSSDELRVVALTAGQLIASLRRLLLAFDGSVPGWRHDVHQLVDQAGRAWSNAARVWDDYSLPAPPDAGVLLASRDLTTSIRAALHHDGVWIPERDVALATEAGSALEVCRHALRGMQEIGSAQARRVASYQRTGWLLGRATQLTPTVERLPDAIRGHWIPVAPLDQVRAAIAYRTVSHATRAAASALRCAVYGEHVPSLHVGRTPGRRPMTPSATTMSR